MPVRIACGLLAGLALAAASPAAGVEPVKIAQADDRSVTVTTAKYVAKIGPDGVLAELRVGGQQTIRGGFPTKLEKAPSINVIEKLVAIRSGKARLEYTFGPDTIRVESEGYPLGYRYTDGVAAALVPGGKGGPVNQRNWYANSRGVVLAGGLTITWSMPMHIGPTRDRRMVPSAYCNGSKKAGDLLKSTFTVGRPAEAVQMLSRITLTATTAGYGDLHKGGNAGYGMVHFPDPERIVFATSQANLGAKPFAGVQYRLTVLDHYTDGKTVFDESLPAELPAKGKAAMQWKLPKLAPGFYYATVRLLAGEKELTNTRQTFSVDLNRYRPSLTWPDDFKAFWKAKLDAMRKIPFDAKLTQLKDKSTDPLVHHALELNGPTGKRIKTSLHVPRRPGKYLATMSSRPGPHIRIGLPLPETATFRRWVSKDDNNLLECILLAVRLTDYLRSRDDVERIYLFGASRTGPIQFINAALDPTKICGLDIHVPTSAGCSWTDKHYRAWGGKPRKLSWAKYTTMAAYVDPVNHAPDMIVPWIVAYGVDDTLAHPQGIEAMFQYSPAAWKRISRDGGGHQYTKHFQKIQKALAAFLKLDAAGRDGEAEKILKEH